MKKRYIIILLSILILLSLANVIFGLFSNKGNKEVDISGKSFQNIEIDTGNTTINFIEAKDEAYVQLNNSNEHLKVETEGNTLDIEVNKKWWRSWFSFDFNWTTPELNVYLPKEIYQTIKIETKNGEVNMTNFKAEEVNIKTKNGKIVVNGLESTYIYTETDNGKVELNNVVGKIIGKTDNGSITVVKDSLNSPMDLEADNGKIIIYTKEAPENVSFELKTDNGHISVFGSEFFDTVVGNGENRIKLETDNGDINIQRQ